MTDLFEETNTESARRLVTVQVVTSLQPIAGKDRIELAQVMGWFCIVKKGQFSVGDHCVFHEPDTVVNTMMEQYQFLAPKAKADGKYRIKTMRMAGVLSQGLVSPMSDLPPFNTYEVGQDVTQVLHCEKYDPYSDHAQSMRSCPAARRFWPNDARPKTDETRLQSCLWVVEEFNFLRDNGNKAYAALKLDGSSMTLMNVGKGVQLCSRNFEILMEEDPDGTFTQAVQKLGLVEKIPVGYAVQGELIGPGIQHNRLGLQEVQYRVFNVFSYSDDARPKLMNLQMMQGFCQTQGLTMVPILNDDFVFDTEKPVQAVFDLMRKMVYAGTTFPVEGVVIRPHVPVQSKMGRLSVKVINPEFEMRT